MKDINEIIEYKDKKYKIVFNINVMEMIQNEYTTFNNWIALTSQEEPDFKAIKFAIKEALNEGIDISNEDNGTDEKFLTDKQVGRIITEVGLKEATEKFNNEVIKSTKTEEKNA